MRALIGIIAVLGVVGGAVFAFWRSDAAIVLVTDAQATAHGEGMLHVALTLENPGEPDQLVAVGSPEARGAKVVSQDASVLPVPAGASVSLSADGAYIMLTGVEGALSEGRLVPLSLTFDEAGTVTAKARIAKPMMMAHGAMGMGYDVPADEPQPSLSLSVLAQPEGGWALSVAVQNFTFSKEAVDGPHEAGVGHGHLYVGGVKLGRLYEASATIPPLPKGSHTVRVTLNTNDHRTYRVGGKPVTATAEITVD